MKTLATFTALAILCVAFPNASTTVAPQTTTMIPMTTTAIPTDPAVGNWTVSENRHFCIMADMGIRLKFHYNRTHDKPADATVDVPVDATTSQGSSCTDPQKLQLNFDKSGHPWSILFDFTKDKDNNVQVKDISVNYFTDLTTFPDMMDPNTTVTAEITNQKLFAAPQGQSYMCNTKETYKLQNLVEMTLVKLHIQAYLNTTSQEFGEIIECPADNKTSNIVPIAVGAALAALVVIVLIAYLISRNRNKRGYESV